MRWRLRFFSLDGLISDTAWQVVKEVNWADVIIFVVHTRGYLREI